MFPLSEAVIQRHDWLAKHAMPLSAEAGCRRFATRITRAPCNRVLGVRAQSRQSVADR